MQNHGYASICRNILYDIYSIYWIMYVARARVFCFTDFNVNK